MNGDNVDYLADNAKKDGVTVTDSGLQYKVLAEGDGAQPGASDTVEVHYTGTLTDGRPQIVSIDSHDGMAEDDILRVAASLDQASKHPVAQAIVATAKARGFTLPSGKTTRLMTTPGSTGPGIRSVRLNLTPWLASGPDFANATAKGSRPRPVRSATPCAPTWAPMKPFGRDIARWSMPTSGLTTCCLPRPPAESP